jgi:hypothetical protein
MCIGVIAFPSGNIKYDRNKVKPFLNVDVTADVKAPNRFVNAATQDTPRNPAHEKAINIPNI